MRRLAVILISLVTALTGVAPAQAFPSVAAPKVQSQAADVQTVQYNGHPRWSRHNNRHWRGDRGRHWRGDRHWRDDRRYSHRRYHRHRNNNAGAIIGGLAAGAIIGGAIASSQQPRYYRGGGGGNHVNWCYSQYRSYRASDNTFQPYNGPRRQCYSPY